MKKMWITIFLLCNSGLFAQDDYQKWLEKENKQLKNYISEEDKKFIEFLKKEWVKTDINESPKLLRKPKPKDIPVFSPMDKTEKITPLNETVKSNDSKNINVLPKEEPPENVIKTEQKVPAITEIKTELKPSSLIVDFYGEKIALETADKTLLKIQYPVNNKSISKFYEETSKENFNSIIQNFIKLKSSSKTNDWSLINLVFNTSEKFTDEINSRYLLTWYFLVKAGYFARVAYYNDNILLLIQSNSELFGLPFFRIENKIFYALNLQKKNKKLFDNAFIYKSDFSSCKYLFNFTAAKRESSADEISERNIEILYKGKKENYVLPFYKYSPAYYYLYPQVQIQNYPKNFPEGELQNQLLLQLRNRIGEMNQRDALNYILHFVQQATDYKTDDEQFGFEKPLFPEESFYYKYSDCEDRSILFAYLTGQLLKLDVILLDYPDHIASAVLLNGVIGDKVIFEGKEYLICDPTYLGADIGMCMPNYKKTTPGIIKIN